MFDTRISLASNTVLALDNKRYIIRKEIGRGANCIVYDAFYIDNIQEKHTVRIKECYPCEGTILREQNTNALLIDKDFDFENVLIEFEKAYKKNITFRETFSNLVNSTSDSRELCKANNTCYIISNYIAATDYEEFKEASIKDIFSRMKTLCKIVSYYHHAGYLCLDIKPANILALSETTEQVVLFDFDSMIEKQSLYRNENIKISCSDGFTALEMLRGDYKNICEATDIFSIGAVIFYKLFGSVPKSKDKKMFAIYDFSMMKNNFNLLEYQPKLLTCLTEFFHKTISSTVQLRYQSMERVIEHLEKLEILSDLDKIQVMDNFSYNFLGFYGRENTLEEIDDLLQTYDHIFLSGIGGIGKTELARKYAQCNRKKYNRIIFLPFEENFEKTICSDCLFIKGLDIDINNNFQAKLNIIKNDLDKEDLIILDNFDGKLLYLAEQIEHFFEIPCKFIVTSRDDFQDMNYQQIYVDKIDNMSDLKSIFKKNNKNEYSEYEDTKIEQIIEHLEGHTMSVDLVSKYLKITSKKPSEFLKELLDKEQALSNTEEVIHRKDNKSREVTIKNHIKAIFDLSIFDELERELMMSLSLLGPIRISKQLFYKLFDKGNNECCLEDLIVRGWIQESDDQLKVSLHQLVLDLVYTDLCPDAQTCSCIIQNMIIYMQGSDDSNLSYYAKKKICNCFIERIKGNNTLLANFYLIYYRHIDDKKGLLDRIEQICVERTDIESFFIRMECKSYRVREIKNEYQWQGEDVCIDDIAYEVEQKVNNQVIEMKKITNILLDNANTSTLDRIVQLSIGMIKELIILIQQLCNDYLEYELKSEGFKKVIYTASSLLEEMLTLSIQYDVSIEVKKMLYEYASNFYDENDYVFLQISEFIGDSEKAAMYAEEKLRLEDYDESTVELGLVSYCDAAIISMEKENYIKAIELFEKSLELKEATSIPIQIYTYIAECYFQLTDYQSAIRYITIARKESLSWMIDDTDLVLKLVESYEKLGEIEKAKEILYTLLDTKETKELYVMEQRIYAFIKVLKLENKDIGKVEFKHVKDRLDYLFYKNYVCNDTEPYLYCFCYYKQKNLVEACSWLFQIAGLYAKEYNYQQSIILYEALTKIEKLKEVDKKTYLTAALYMIIEKKDWNMESDYQLLLGCKYIEHEIDTNIFDYEWLSSLLKKTVLSISFENNQLYTDEDKKKMKETCNYYLLTTREVALETNSKEIFKLWMDAYKEYMDISYYKKALDCLEEGEKVLKDDCSIKESECFIELYINMSIVNEKLEDFESENDCLLILFKYIATNKEHMNKYEVNRGLDYISNTLYKANEAEAAIFVQLSKIYNLDMNMNKKINFDDSTLFDKKLWKLMFQSVQNFLIHKIEKKDEDIVVNTLENIIKYCDNDGLENYKNYCMKKVHEYKTSILEEK